MKKYNGFLERFFLVILLAKLIGTGEGANITWPQVFIPLIVYVALNILRLIMVVSGWDDSFKIWAAAKVQQVINWKNAKKMYRNTMRQAKNAANKGQK